MAKEATAHADTDEGENRQDPLGFARPLQQKKTGGSQQDAKADFDDVTGALFHGASSS